MTTAMLMCCAVPFEGPVCCCGRSEWHVADSNNGRQLVHLPDVVPQQQQQQSTRKEKKKNLAQEEKSLTDWKLVGRDLKSIAHQFRNRNRNRAEAEAEVEEATSAWRGVWHSVVFLVLQRWMSR